MMRAARFTTLPKKSLSRLSTTPAWSPQRARSATPSVATGSASACWKLERGGDRVLRVVERGAHAVAGHLDHAAAMRLDGRAGKRVVPRERAFHSRRLALPQLSAALDIGEEEGRDRGLIVHARKSRKAASAGRLLYGSGQLAASAPALPAIGLPPAGSAILRGRCPGCAWGEGRAMNPLLNERIAQFDSPFRRLDELLAGIAPNPELTPIIMSVGEPQDAPPALLAESVATHAHLWNRYPPAAGTPEFRRAAQGYLHRRYEGTRDRIDPDARDLAGDQQPRGSLPRGVDRDGPVAGIATRSDAESFLSDVSRRGDHGRGHALVPAAQRFPAIRTGSRRRRRRHMGARVHPLPVLAVESRWTRDSGERDAARNRGRAASRLSRGVR